MTKEKVQRLKKRYLDSFEFQEDFDKMVTPVFLEMRGLSLSRDTLTEDLSNFIGDILETEPPSAPEVEQPRVQEGSGENVPGCEVVVLDASLESPPRPALRSAGEPRCPGRSFRPRKGPRKASQKSKGKAIAEPQAPSNARVPMLLFGSEAEAFFSTGGDRMIPQMPTALSRTLEDGARGGMSLAILLMQAGMGLGDLYSDLSGQEDNLKSAQTRARDFKSQLAIFREELGKTKEDLQAARERCADATRRVTELEEELQAIRANRWRELEDELQAIRANHRRELESVSQSSRKEGVRDYLAGHRNRYQVDFGKTFNSSLLFRVFVAQAQRQGLESFRFDPKDFCGYVPPPVDVFKDDGEDPLEAWNVHSLAPETGIKPDMTNLLHAGPVPKLAAPATSSGVRYERMSGNKRRVVCGESRVDEGGDAPREGVDAEMADAATDDFPPAGSP